MLKTIIYSIITVLAVMTFVLLISSCTTVYVPYDRAMTDVEFSGGDCCDKSATWQLALAGAGEVSRVCAGYMGTTGSWSAHAWVEVYCHEDHQWHLLEVSSIESHDGWPVDQYPEYVRESVWYGVPSAVEIKKDVGPDWRSDKSRAELVQMLPVSRQPRASEGMYLE